MLVAHRQKVLRKTVQSSFSECHSTINDTQFSNRYPIYQTEDSRDPAPYPEPPYRISKRWLKAPTAEATSSLQDRAEGNARKTQANEGAALLDVSRELAICRRRLTASEGEFWQQAMFCLHFWLTRSWTAIAMMGTGICQYGRPVFGEA